MLNNDPATNRPTIPIYADDGAYNPWGFEQHPQTMPQLNTVWSCPSGTPVIAIAGAGRETVSFQVYVTAGVGANSALGSVNLTVSLSTAQAQPLPLTTQEVPVLLVTLKATFPIHLRGRIPPPIYSPPGRCPIR